MSHNKNNNGKQILKVILICLVISVVFSLPLLINNSIYDGHDFMFHISRIEALSYAFKNGDLFPKVFYAQAYNYGYGTPLFYSNIFIMLPALLTSLGVNVIVSYKWFIFIITFITALSMYYASNKIFKTEKLSIIATVLYVFASYRISDVYVRAAVGEYLAFMIIPLIMAGAYDLVNHKPKAWLSLSIGFGLLLLAHNISFIIICISFGVYLLFDIKQIKDKETIKQLLLAIIIAIGLSSFFLFPMLEQMRNKIYVVNTYFDSFDSMNNSLLNVGQLFQIDTTYGYLYNDGQVINMSGGIILIILTLVGVWLFRKNKSYLITGIVMMLVLLATTKYFPWQYLKPLWFIQFSCRLLVITVPIMVLLSAKTIDYVLNKTRVVAIAICAIVVGITTYQFLPIYQHGIIDTNNPTVSDKYLLDSDYSIVNTYYALSGKEYLPSANADDYDTRGLIVETNSTNPIEDYVHSYNSTTFANASEGSAFYILPLVYYKGYSVEVLDNNTVVGRIVPTYSENGLVMFQSEGDSTNKTYHISYTGTTIQKVSSIITIVTIIFIIAILIIGEDKVLKMKRNKKTLSL